MSSDFETPRPLNILRGIVPVASGWDTAPTNLERCTDGDLATVTGTGSAVLGGSGRYGWLVFDLGWARPVILACRAGIWSSAGRTTVMFEESSDNTNFYSSQINQADISSTNEFLVYTNAAITTQRYIKLRFYVSAAATAYAKIYEVMGWELTI